MGVWTARLFERHVLGRIYERRLREYRRNHPNEQRRLKGVSAGLDTPWRVASFLQSALIETDCFGRWTVPRPPEESWRRGEGNAGDYAALALEVFRSNGREAFFVTVYGPTAAGREVFCAGREEDDGWYQISSSGMFGGYDSLQAIASDVVDDWRLVVVRDARMALCRRSFLPRNARQVF